MLATVSRAAAQIIEEREFHGKQITCALSGLRGFGASCGIDPWYAYIFVGSVLQTVELSETEWQVELAPEEVFSGKPPATLTVFTSQGACLPEIRAGDKWLLYLQHDEDAKRLLLAYGSPSKPLAEAQEDLALLRRLTQMTDQGVIVGSVSRDEMKEGAEVFSPVVGHQVVATRSDGTKYLAVTDANGDYEFPPLATGSYEITANTAEGLWAEDGPTTVSPRSCRRIDFELRLDGRISGHVSRADGSPMANADVAVLAWPPDGSMQSVTTNEDGQFEFKGLAPGRYLVGIGIQADRGTPEWKSRLYYPGVRKESQAAIINLGRSERRTNIDLVLPSD